VEGKLVARFVGRAGIYHRFKYRIGLKIGSESDVLVFFDEAEKVILKKEAFLSFFPYNTTEICPLFINIGLPNNPLPSLNP